MRPAVEYMPGPRGDVGTLVDPAGEGTALNQIKREG